MITVPHLAENVLDAESPIHGNLDDVLAQRDIVQGVAADAGSFFAFTRSAGDALQGQDGQAVLRISEKLDERVKPGAKALADSADAALRALDLYATEIQYIHQRAQRVLLGVEADLHAIREAAHVLARIALEIGAPFDCIWNDGPPWHLPDPPVGQTDPGFSTAPWTSRGTSPRAIHEGNWRLSASTWHSAIDDVEAAQRVWNDLVQQRTQAEQTLRAALALTVIGQLMTLGAADGFGYRRTIATAISGELWGVRAARLATGKTHPLLARLIGTRSGAGIWDNPPDPVMVATNWARLSEPERQRLIDEMPWVIGNLPGLPYAVRNEANRRQLEFAIVHRDELGATSRAAVDEITKVLEQERREIARKGRANPPVQLVALNLHGPVPMSAIGYGDLDAAANLTWQIPGMFNDTPQGLPGWNRASRNLFAEQLAQLEIAGRAAEGTGLVAYFEYDTPDPLSVLSAQTAREAAVRLADELDGTFATREAGVPLRNLGVLAHSYGTPVAANALLLTVHPVHSLTMIASAGLDGERLKSLVDLNVARGAEGQLPVYSTMAGTDGTAPFGSNVSGRLQPNPDAAWSDALFLEGAQIFSSDGQGELKHTQGHSIVRADGHGYLDQRTQSLNSAAKLTLGLPDEVAGGLALSETRVLDDVNHARNLPRRSPQWVGQ